MMIDMGPRGPERYFYHICPGCSGSGAAKLGRSTDVLAREYIHTVHDNSWVLHYNMLYNINSNMGMNREVRSLGRSCILGEYVMLFLYFPFRYLLSLIHDPHQCS